MPTDKKTITDWINKQSPEIQKLVKPLRTMARQSMPGAIEMIHHNALGYGTTDSSFDRVCYIAPQAKGYVNVGFFFGVGLPDPENLIQGEGKRLRHVKVYTVGEAKNAALQKLVTIAWKNAAADVAEWRQSLKRSKKP